MSHWQMVNSRYRRSDGYEVRCVGWSSWRIYLPNGKVFRTSDQYVTKPYILSCTSSATAMKLVDRRWPVDASATGPNAVSDKPTETNQESGEPKDGAQ